MFETGADVPSHVAALIAIVSLVVGGVVIAVTAVVAVQWRKYRQNELAASLKQEMLERGMSAAEIVQVLEAGNPPPQNVFQTHQTITDSD